MIVHMLLLIWIYVYKPIFVLMYYAISYLILFRYMYSYMYIYTCERRYRFPFPSYRVLVFRPSNDKASWYCWGAGYIIGLRGLGL